MSLIFVLFLGTIKCNDEDRLSRNSNPVEDVKRRSEHPKKVTKGQLFQTIIDLNRLNIVNDYEQKLIIITKV